MGGAEVEAGEGPFPDMSNYLFYFSSHHFCFVIIVFFLLLLFCFACLVFLFVRCKTGFNLSFALHKFSVDMFYAFTGDQEKNKKSKLTSITKDMSSK